MSDQKIPDPGGFEFEKCRDGGYVNFWYPPMTGEPSYLYIGLMHVRASDGIRIRYDFKRDGWAIEQPGSMGPWASEEAVDYKWAEVAFVSSWALSDPDNNEAKP